MVHLTEKEQVFSDFGRGCIRDVKKLPFLALFCPLCFNLQVEAPCSSRLVHPSCEMTFFSVVPAGARPGSGWLSLDHMLSREPVTMARGAQSSHWPGLCHIHTHEDLGWGQPCPKPREYGGNASAQRKVKVLLPGKGKKNIGKAETADVYWP